VIDTHCHLTFSDYAGRIDEVLAHAAGSGVMGAISIATTTVDSHDTLRIAREYPNVWCTAGVHPLYADEGPHDWDAVREIIKDPKCVAFGELGLDNHYSKPPGDIQRRVLADELACIESCVNEGIDKPVVIHCREAFDDLIPILAASTISPDRFVFHCFTGTPDDVQLVLDFGASVSFTGVVTYANASYVADAACMVPADRIMVETDAPFLSPVPKRGVRPCVPAFSRYTAEHLAKIRGAEFPDFHAQIDLNTEKFFGIKVPPAPAEIIESPCTC
jgi:TatD DNase family protein